MGIPSPAAISARLTLLCSDTKRTLARLVSRMLFSRIRGLGLFKTVRGSLLISDNSAVYAEASFSERYGPNVIRHASSNVTQAARSLLMLAFRILVRRLARHSIS